GSFQDPVNYSVPSMIGATPGDFNEDGKIDVLAAGGDGSVDLLLGNGDATFQAGQIFNPLPTNVLPNSVTAADLNHDGHMDVVIGNIFGGTFNLGTVDVLLGNGDGTFEPAVSYDSGENSEFVAVADLNGDGNPDLAIATLNTDGVNILLGTGD